MERMRLAIVSSGPAGTELAARDELPATLARCCSNPGLEGARGNKMPSAVVATSAGQGADRGIIPEWRGGRCGPPLRCPNAGQLGALGDPGKVDEASVRLGALSPATDR